MNEFDLINQARPDVAPYDPGTKAMARDRLLKSGKAQGFTWRKPYTIAVTGALAVAAGYVVVAQPSTPPPAAPRMELMSAAQVLNRAAGAAVDEIDPRDDQYIRVKTLQVDDGGLPYEGPTYYRRYENTVWERAGERQPGQRADGAIEQKTLEPLAYPGKPIPESAAKDVGTKSGPLVYCKDSKIDYPSVKGLPADEASMRAHFDEYWKKKNHPTTPFMALMAARNLLWETHLPAAQRGALYKALASFDGMTAAENVRDAAGREGIGVGFSSPDGVRWELIFDRDTYALLGDRQTVVEGKALAHAPAGTLVAASAQLEISVADTAPEHEVEGGNWCNRG